MAWTYDIEPVPGNRGYNTTPLMVGNLMYFPKNAFGTIVAVNATTGVEVWSTVLKEIPGLPQAGATVPNRGISYWPGNGQHAPRVVLGLAQGFLVQLDAKTGKVVDGPAGVINVTPGFSDVFETRVTIGAPPTIYKNSAIFAGRGGGGRWGLPNDPRAFDLLTGKELWRFNLVPHPGEENFGTWGLEGWQDRATAGVWVATTVDPQNGLVYFPLSNPRPQNFAGQRPGTNLYSSGTLALHADTGKFAWFFQNAHHDVFDYDANSPPVLLNTYVGGKPVPSVAQMTKQGQLYVLNRLTGEPIWGVEERGVPRFDAPGDQTWSTQPFPVKPPALARQSMDRDEIWTGYDQEHTDYCTTLYDRSWQAGPFTPYGMLPSLVFPGSEGGGSWAGSAVDDERRLLFVNARHIAVLAQLQYSPGGATSPPSYGKSKIPTSYYVGPKGYPCNQPPWSELYAINTATGDIVWQVPVGEYEELKARGITGTGTATAAGGPLATAGGLVFIGASNDAKIRALDSATGKELWSASVDENVRTNPMSYLGADGKQYIIAIAGGGDDGFNVPQRPRTRAKIVAFKLP